jgi:hypothetical protein
MRRDSISLESWIHNRYRLANRICSRLPIPDHQREFPLFPSAVLPTHQVGARRLAAVLVGNVTRVLKIVALEPFAQGCKRDSCTVRRLRGTSRSSSFKSPGSQQSANVKTVPAEDSLGVADSSFSSPCKYVRLRGSLRQSPPSYTHVSVFPGPFL